MEPLTGSTGKVDAAGEPAKPWVSVIIPALNEEETIGNVVHAVLAAFRFVWRSLHGHGPVPRNPTRCLEPTRHAGDDLWMEPRDANAGGASRIADSGDSGRPSAAPRWSFQGIGHGCRNAAGGQP